MVAFPQPDGFGFGSALEHLCAPQLEILDQDDAVAVREHGAVRIPDDARGLGLVRLGFARPLVAARGAFPLFRGIQNLGHLTHRTGRFAHGPEIRDHFTPGHKPAARSDSWFLVGPTGSGRAGH